jgi:hypothetical protein
VLAVVLLRTTTMSRRRVVWIALAAASLLTVLLITLSPGRAGGTYRCEFSGSFFDWVHVNQSTANVAMLVPVALALPLAARATRWYPWSFVVLLLLPVVIETTQARAPLTRRQPSACRLASGVRSSGHGLVS